MRRNDIERFYKILKDLQGKVGLRKLSKCDGRMQWPQRGVYFFFEDGELRNNGLDARVVRVGTHAVNQGSRTTLWSRLKGHKGTNAGGGNHRGSIFRLHVGSAIIKNERIDCPTWGSRTKNRALELPLELRVSQYIGNMPFTWVEADDVPGANSGRAYLERNSIALLSNLEKDPIDSSSDQWLGLSADRVVIGQSSLWNVNHVGDDYDPAFLDTFETLVQSV